MPADPMTLSLRREGDHQIVVERTFAAKPARVFEAFTVDEQVRRWLDTPEWPLLTCRHDLRVGGTIRYEWGNQAGGPAMGMSGTYRAVDPPHRLEHVELFDEDWTDGEVLVVTEFLDDGTGGTRVRMTMTYSSTAARDRVADGGMARGMDLNFLTLDDLLAGRAGMFGIDLERDLVLERIVPAPPSRVWAAWTEPALIARWFAPAPWSVASARVEPWPGGAFDVVMQSPEGERMTEPPGSVLVAIPRRLLVWTDALGPGFVPRAAPFMAVAVQLRPHPEGTRYRILVRHATPEARARHLEMGFEHGWNAAADQLVGVVSEPV